MGFDAEWQLAGCMKRGMRGSGLPAGHMSEKQPCPDCGKKVGGRTIGMGEHLRTKHHYSRTEADARMAEAGIQWRTPSERTNQEAS